MSIQITTRLPVINGFVQVPSARIAYKTTLVPSDVTTTISDSEVIKVVGDQRVELPTFDREDQYPNDWHQTVRDLL